MKKRLLSAWLILVILASLTACSKGTKEGSATGIRFETTDLDGNTVKAEDVFKEHRLTMVNLWGTYCGPCIGEMPDLEKLNQRLAEKDCAIVGVVVDVPSADDSAMIGLAKEITAGTGVTYLNLVPWSTLGTDLKTEFIPATFFIDANGEVLGEPAIGARGADDYEALVDSLLEQMDK